MKLIDEIDLTSVPIAKLEAMLQAGEAVCECRQALRNSGDNIVSEMLKGEEAFYELKRYPTDGVYDKRSRSLFYYHAHPTSEQRDEHGHFHTFLRSQKLPSGGAPAPANGADSQHPIDGPRSHIVAISMDRSGTPTKLFTTNRWVTDEVWHDAKETSHFLDRFAINHAQPSWLVNRWLASMLVLFGPQINLLIHARDQKIAGWRDQHPDEDVLEDRELEIASEMEIDVDRHLAAVRGAVTKQKDSIAAAEQAARQSEQKQQIAMLRDDLATAQEKVASRERDIEAARKEAELAIVQKYAGQIKKLQNTYADETKALAVAADDRVAKDLDKKIAEARSAWNEEAKAKVQEWQKAGEEALARKQKAAIADAHTEWQRENRKLLAEAAEQWQTAETQRFAKAKAQWAVAQRDALAERDEQWQAEFDRQMAGFQTVSSGQEQTTDEYGAPSSITTSQPQHDDEDARRGVIGPRLALAASLFVALVVGGIFLIPGAKSKLADSLQPLMTNIRAEAMELRKVFRSTRSPDNAGDTSASADPAPAIVKPIYIRPSAANLRAKPSKTASVIAIVPRGVQVERLEVRQGWVRIRSTGPGAKDGWVHSSLLTDAPTR